MKLQLAPSAAARPMVLPLTYASTCMTTSCLDHSVGRVHVSWPVVDVFVAVRIVGSETRAQNESHCTCACAGQIPPGSDAQVAPNASGAVVVF